MWRLNRCLKCAYYAPENNNCPAFPNKIPKEIWSEKRRHDKVLLSQSGEVIYTPKLVLFGEMDKGEEGIVLQHKIILLEKYFFDLLIQLLNGDNPFNQIRLRELANSINLFYRIESTNKGIKITTKFYFLYNRNIAEYSGGKINFDNKQTPVEFKQKVNKIKERTLERKLSELHYLYNSPIWKNNTLLISMDLNHRMNIDLFKNHDKETQTIYYKYWEKPENNYSFLNQDLNETLLLQQELDRLKKMDVKLEISPNKAKKIIVKYIKKENKNKPWKDQELKELLEAEEQGYFIWRRDIASYREELGIKVARLRKKDYLSHS